MLVRELKDHLGPSQYAALQSIPGFENVNPYTHIAGLTENGNYHILYLPDGSKLRFSAEDSLDPERPECIDCTITKKCDGGCKFCYMSCTPDGKHAPLRDGHNLELLDQIAPYTELAINGNDLSHPDIDWFLRYMATKNVFVNITINQQHFAKYFNRIINWHAHGLVRGIGVSYTGLNAPGLINKLRAAGPSVVVHVIAGLLTMEEWDFLSKNNLSILILGYKEMGRGTDYHSRHLKMVEKRMVDLESLVQNAISSNSNNFRSIAFDGLSIEQLHVKDWLDPQLYESAYAGDEGSYTFYLDLVDQKYSISSISDKMIPCENLSINEMFRSIKREPLTFKPIRRSCNEQES